MKRIVPIILFLVVKLPLLAQQTITVSDTYTYYAPPSMNPPQAKAEAVHQAQLHIIAQNFGTVISSSFISRMSEVDGKSSSFVSNYGECEVKGEWVETIGDPVIKQEIVDNHIATTVSIKGKIREFKFSQIEVSAKPLSDGSNSKSECYSFKNKQNVNLLFEAPVKGYAAVYLSDNTTVYRMLPGRNEESPSFEVKARKKYCFFDGDFSDGEFSDKMRLVTNAEIEINRLYVIFSPNLFTKAIDETDEDRLNSSPVQSWGNFQKWLGKCRRQDSDMVVKAFDIEITR